MTSLSAIQRRLRALFLRGFCLLGGGAAACACTALMATGIADQQRFQLSGSGVLQLDAPMQKSGNVQLTARLVPGDARFATLLPVQEGGVFALKASLAAAAMVCYNDTIFRDDFDADGF
jgi:hypothetical protein